MIAIIDYGAGNLRSVEKALTAIGEESIVTRDRHEILNADKVILPGVGAFGDAMNSLKKYELDKVIHEVCDMDKPFLGICLGLQLLFEGSDESQGVEGLHVLDGQILRIPDKEGLKIPHIGWNSLDLQNNGRLFKGLSEHMRWFFWILRRQATTEILLWIWSERLLKRCLYRSLWAAASEQLMILRHFLERVRTRFQ